MRSDLGGKRMDLNEIMPQEITDVIDKHFQSIDWIIQINVFALKIIMLWRKGLIRKQL